MTQFESISVFIAAVGLLCGMFAWLVKILLSIKDELTKLSQSITPHKTIIELIESQVNKHAHDCDLRRRRKDDN